MRGMPITQNLERDQQTAAAIMERFKQADPALGDVNTGVDASALTVPVESVPAEQASERAAMDSESRAHAHRLNVDRVIAAGFKSLLTRPIASGYRTAADVETYLRGYALVTANEPTLPVIIEAFDALYPQVRAENPEVAAMLARYREETTVGQSGR